MGTEPDFETLLGSYLTLAALAPLYPAICLANEIEGNGYYFIN